MGAIERQASLLWDTKLAGAGDGAGEALCTSSSSSWRVMVGCLGGFKQLSICVSVIPLLISADDGEAKLVAKGMAVKGVVVEEAL